MRQLALLSVALMIATACSDDSGPTATDATTTTTTTSVATPTTGAPLTTTLPVVVDIDLLTYNVAGLPDALSGSEPATNTPLIGPLLNAYDLVLVQESWLTPEGVDQGSQTYHEILLDLTEHEYESASLAAPLGSDVDRPSALLSDGLNRFSDFPFTSVERQRWLTCGVASADCLSLKAALLADAGLTDICTELGCDEPNRIDKVLYRSSDDVIISALEWRNESAAFTRDDGEPLSDHEPVAVRLQLTAS